MNIGTPTRSIEWRYF